MIFLHTRDWMLSWQFLEKQWDTPDSWHLIWSLHETDFQIKFVTGQVTEIGQWKKWINSIPWIRWNTLFLANLRTEMDIWGSRKWILKVWKVPSASIDTYVRARHSILEVSGLQRMHNADTIRETNISNKLIPNTQYVWAWYSNYVTLH